jgi:uncharacterized protein YgiM (DUF1202 family)
MMNKKKIGALGLVLALIVFGTIMSYSTIQAQEFGTNWSGTFYANTSLSGTGVPVTGIAGLNFNWGSGPPVINNVAVPGIGSDNFSALFTSTQTFNAGTYTFNVVSDDGVRVFIDGTQVLDDFTPHAAKTDTFTVNMTQGLHVLTVNYVEFTDQAVLQVQWGFGGGVVGTTGPSPTPGPTNTPLPTGLPAIPSGAITATVIRAPVLNVRAGPSVFSGRVGSILRGQTYQVIGRDPNARWFLLQLSSFQGWALGYYLYIPQNEFNAPVVSDFVLGGNPASISGVVAQSFATLRLRQQPNIYSPQIGRVTWGGAMAVTGKTPHGDWYRVVWKGTTGWVASGWVRIVEGSIGDVPVVTG